MKRLSSTRQVLLNFIETSYQLNDTNILSSVQGLISVSVVTD